MLDAWVVWQVPAEPGPHPGRGAEAGHRPQAVSQGREGPLPLQRTWGRTAAAFSVTCTVPVLADPYYFVLGTKMQDDINPNTVLYCFYRIQIRLCGGGI